MSEKIAQKFKEYHIPLILREENERVDALTKLASATTCIKSRTMPVVHLTKPSTAEPEELIVVEIRPHLNNWITPLRRYLEENILPIDVLEAKRIRYRSTQYTIINGEVYRKRFSKALQRCIVDEEVEQILEDIHSGICGNHTGGKSLAHKVLRQGFYWPTRFTEA